MTKAKKTPAADRFGGRHAQHAEVAELPPQVGRELVRAIDRVRAGAGIFNSYRGQSTTIRNLLAVGDAVCTTNPMGARGVALGIESAAALADIVAGAPSDAWAASLDEWCLANQKVWHDDHVITDDALLAAWRGDAFDLDGPVSWMLVAAAAREHHPEWMASLGPFFGMQAKPAVLDPLRAEVRAMLRDGWRPAAPAGPTRDDLAAAIASRVAAVDSVRHQRIACLTDA